MFKILYAMVKEHMADGFEDDLVFADGEYEMMLFETETFIEVNGEMNAYPPHTGIIYKPGQRVHYMAKSGTLVYTWIRFDCDEPLFAEGYVPFGIPIYCANYDYFLRYWELVACENFWHNQSEEHIITDLMHIIFHWFHDYAFPSESSRYQNVLENLRANIYAHPEYDWTLEKMAEQANMSTRSLLKLYKDFAHISCIAEVIESRMTRAKMLLMQTKYTIDEISRQCGYHNVEHFCRQFKRHENISPGKYRKQHQIKTDADASR
ncbi:MAG: helix-turn-helix transcriptional regulator [Lachnospiraceae bacterium]|nr:helix-turn-helix transcriptional regulator [Lachnospiraceae bacterium]